MRGAFVVLVAVVLLPVSTLGARMVPAKASAPQASTAPTPQGVVDATLVGCLAKGRGPDSYVLEKAKTPKTSPTEAGATYVLGVREGRTMDFSVHVGHKVQVIGEVRPAGQPGQPGTLVASIVLPVSNLCTQTP
jgi:hypothetical protein